MRVGNQAALQELAERIAQADAVVIGGGSGLSSAAGYDHYHWSPALSEALAPFREQYGFTSPLAGFYHCFSNATETTRQNIISQRQSDLYDETLKGWEDEHDWTVKDSVWAKVTFDNLFTTTVQDTETETVTESATE